MTPKLKTEVKVFIVQCLARYMSPSEVVQGVKENFKVDIERQHVRHYNPEQNESAKGKWGEMFEMSRKDYLASVSQIGIAQQTYRLEQLQKLYHDAGQNRILKKDLLEQAAKETGGAFTNKQQQEVNVKGNMVTGTLQEWQAEREKRRQETEATMAEFGDEEKN